MTNKLPTTRWAFDLSTWTPSLHQLVQAVAVIQPEEKIRLMKFHFIDDFLSSLVGRLLMRKYVSQCCDIPYAEIKFARDSRGKPYWLRNELVEKNSTKQPALSFNVSHQGNFVILAGVVNNTLIEFDDFGIGCDVMKVEYSGGKDLQEFFRIMHTKFADSEWRFISQPHFNPHQQLEAFMRHWCLKESYVKELGVGITVDLQKIAFSVDTSRDLTMKSQPLCGATLKCSDLPMSHWYFEEHMLRPNYCAAIAFRNFKPQTQGVFHFLSIPQLLQKTAIKNEKKIIDYCLQALSKPRK